MATASAFTLIALLELWRQGTEPDPSGQRWITNLGLFGVEQILWLTSVGCWQDTLPLSRDDRR